MARAAVYNRFWSTAGGGEKFAGGIAEVLSRVHDVTLLTPEPFDVAALAEHLQLDLSATTLRVIQSEPNAATAASADYDIFVNPSFASDAVNLARKGLYVVHFADLDPPQPPVQGRLLTPRKWFGHLSDASIKGLPPRPTWAGGVYGTERHGRLPYRWTNGQARLAVPHGPRRRLVIALVGLQTAEVGPRTVTVHGIGLTPATTTVPPRRAEGNKQLQPLRLIRVTVPASPTATILHIDSEGWAALGDNRTLGVALAGVWEAGSGSAASLAGALATFSLNARN